MQKLKGCSVDVEVKGLSLLTLSWGAELWDYSKERSFSLCRSRRGHSCWPWAGVAWAAGFQPGRSSAAYGIRWGRSTPPSPSCSSHDVTWTSSAAPHIQNCLHSEERPMVSAHKSTSSLPVINTGLLTEQSTGWPEGKFLDTETIKLYCRQTCTDGLHIRLAVYLIWTEAVTIIITIIIITGTVTISIITGTITIITGTVTISIITGTVTNIIIKVPSTSS